MNLADYVDVSSDDEAGQSNEEIIKKEPNLHHGNLHSKRKCKIEKAVHLKSQKKVKQESINDKCSNVLSNSQRNLNMLDQGTSLVDESRPSYASTICAAPIIRQFWKAGDYASSKATSINSKNHLRINPMFLHSNATSHKWVFGALAELLDNAIDEIQNGATFVSLDKVSNPRDGSPALLIHDDGGGMNPEILRQCMSFGFSDKKSKTTIGQYGNGFKTSTMRLGADVIVFSRHLKDRTQTQSVGLLSYTFLRQTGHDRIVVPMVDYEFNESSSSFEAILTHGEEHFSSNMSILLQWSPYSTEEELLKQFDDIGNHGTKVIVYNLWLKDDGDMELDFDTNSEDICIRGGSRLFQAADRADPIKDRHIANTYRFSLRAYSSILYLRIPQSFRIILRGRIVELLNIANDMIFPEFVLYRPSLGVNVEAKVITTIGFWKDSPLVNFNGFCIYHRNRLIMPFWSLIRTTRNLARGVVGVLEADFMEPTHNKQDFEKTSLFLKLESRLKEMAVEYWHLHCALIGHQLTKESLRVIERSQSSSTTRSSKEPVSKNLDFVAETQITSQEGTNVMELEHGCKTRQADEYNKHANGSEKRLQDPERLSLLKENKKLKSQLSEIKKRENKHNIKVQRLRHELEAVERSYTKLLNNIKDEEIVNVQC